MFAQMGCVGVRQTTNSSIPEHVLIDYVESGSGHNQSLLLFLLHFLLFLTLLTFLSPCTTTIDSVFSFFYFFASPVFNHTIHDSLYRIRTK